MSKKCIYCKTQIEDSSVMDVCRRCGIGVWGEKMFNAILSSMESARDAGDLYQGSVSDTQSTNKQIDNSYKKLTEEVPAQKSTALASMAVEAMKNQEQN